MMHSFGFSFWMLNLVFIFLLDFKQGFEEVCYQGIFELVQEGQSIRYFTDVIQH